MVVEENEGNEKLTWALGITIRPAVPFSWQQTVNAIRGAPHLQGYGRELPGDDSGARELALRVGVKSPRVVPFRLTPHGVGGTNSGLLTLAPAAGHELTEGELEGATAEVRQSLTLDLDLTPLVQEAANDPAFEVVERELRGLHPVLFRSAFEAACYMIVRQRTPPTFALKSMGRLTELLGAQVAGSNGPLWLFPEARVLAHGARPELLAATNNVRKVERLAALAQEFVAVNERELSAMSYDELFRWLKSLPGLGPWSAEQVAWRGLGRFERVPWRDTGALGAIRAAYAPGFDVEAGHARRLARYYGELQGVWMWYLKTHERSQRETG